MRLIGLHEGLSRLKATLELEAERERRLDTPNEHHDRRCSPLDVTLARLGARDLPLEELVRLTTSPSNGFLAGWDLRAVPSDLSSLSAFAGQDPRRIPSTYDLTLVPVRPRRTRLEACLVELRKVRRRVARRIRKLKALRHPRPEVVSIRRHRQLRQTSNCPHSYSFADGEPAEEGAHAATPSPRTQTGTIKCRNPRSSSAVWSWVGRSACMIGRMLHPLAAPFKRTMSSEMSNLAVTFLTRARHA